MNDKPSPPKVTRRAALAACANLALFPAALARYDARIRLGSRFVPFGLCMQDMPPVEQVALCRKLGYTGLGLGGGDANSLKQFADLPEVQSGQFRVCSMLWWAKANQTFDQAALDWLDGILTQAERMKMALWMVADGKPNDATSLDEAVNTLCFVAKQCRAHKVQLVLYPHLGCTFETAEDGLAVYHRLAQRGYPEVRTSIHLCHEVKAGNGDRLPEVIAKVAPYLALASVSGADRDARARGGWETAIKPLDQGTYDPRPFLKALAAHGYKGPMELHTYGLPDPRKDDHLVRSLARWNTWVLPTDHK